MFREASGFYRIYNMSGEVIWNPIFSDYNETTIAGLDMVWIFHSPTHKHIFDVAHWNSRSKEDGGGPAEENTLVPT